MSKPSIQMKCSVVGCKSTDGRLCRKFPYFETTEIYILCYKCAAELTRRIENSRRWYDGEWTDFTLFDFIKGMNEDSNWPMEIDVVLTN